MKILQQFKNSRHFYGTIGSLNVGALCVGLALGSPSPSFNYLYNTIDSPNSPGYLQESWIDASTNVGATLGSLFSIFITDIYGRRASFYLSAGVLFVFWIFLPFSGPDKVLVISAANVAGFAAGIYSATAILYVAEISLPENRGLVAAVAILFGYLGVFAINVFGYFVQINELLCMMSMLPLIFLLTIYFWMIESPYYLFQQGTVLYAKIALKKLRDCRTVLEIDEEYKSMEAFFNSSISKKPGEILRDSLCPSSLRPLTLIIVPLLCVSQMLGVTAISDYAQHLIENVYPRTGNIVTSFIDVVSIILFMFAIERFGRKPLLAFTIVGSAICCLALAIYNLTGEEECRTKQLLLDHKLVPVIVICLYYAIYALGCIPVLPIVTGEIFPCRAKTAAVGICTALLYGVSFCMQASYEVLNERTGSCLAFVYFTILGSVGLPFAIALLPETRGKSLVQIQSDLENIVMVNY